MSLVKERAKLLKEIDILKKKLKVTDYHFERGLTESNLEVYLTALKRIEAGENIDLTKLNWMR